ncbi:MAG: HD domain-containing protein, partial [Polyangiaceae bacterium]|nr:HD domain-containing protein [Polyangiaceae bacterium]
MNDPSMQGLDALVAKVAEHYPEADRMPLVRSFEMLGEQRSAERLRHALDTAMVLAGMRLDPPTVAACLVAPLAGELPRGRIEEFFGKEVGALVDGVVRLQQIRWDRLEEEAAETLRKMFLAMAAEVRVVIIVLALRVQRMRAVQEESSVNERQRLARETLQVFAPLANRLGIWQFKSQLEDLSLRQLDPETFDELEKLLHERRQGRTRLIHQAIAILDEKLPEQGIEATVSGRAKHLYSIYKKMQRKRV